MENEQLDNYEMMNINVDEIDAIELKDDYELVKTSEVEKSRLLSLVTGVSSTVAISESLNKLYTVKFPKGISGELMSLKAGGYSTDIINNGKITGKASINKANSQAIFAGIFETLSVLTNQHYLKAINLRLDKIEMKTDQILEFLHDDKKAELISELNFVKRIYEGYSAIMNNEIQRISTITSLQQSQKVAIKDVEFYLEELKKEMNKKINKEEDINSQTNSLINIKSSLELAEQLYVLSSILEIFISQNFDEFYLNIIKNNLKELINKCSKSISDDFNRFIGKTEGFKKTINLKNDDLEKTKAKVIKDIREIIEDNENNKVPALVVAIDNTIDRVNKSLECAIDQKGNLYIKKN